MTVGVPPGVRLTKGGKAGNLNHDQTLEEKVSGKIYDPRDSV